MSRRILLIVVLSLLLAALPAGAHAQGETPEPPTDNEVNAVAKDLYCPVCENVPLDVCATLACQQWREQISDFLAAGWSEQEIRDYFAEQYGDQVLATPPAHGLNWLFYVLPPLLVLGGGYWFANALRRWRATEAAESAPTAPPGPEDEYQQQLEDELEARR